jgi:hypothetical protein
MKFKTFLSGIIILILSCNSHAAVDRTQLLVWANEAIVKTYTYNYKTYLQDQKQIAQYFTTDGWIAFSKALNDSKLPEAIQKNAYDVTAVATAPPKLVDIDSAHWAVIMPVLVHYANAQHQQQQYLKIVLGVSEAPSGQGMRGFSINSLQSTVMEPPCQCMPAKESKPLSSNAKQAS